MNKDLKIRFLSRVYPLIICLATLLIAGVLSNLHLFIK